MHDGKNSNDIEVEISKLAEEKEQVLASAEHRGLLTLRSDIQKTDSAIKGLNEDIASDFSVLKRPLKKFQRKADEHSQLIDNYLDDPLGTLKHDSDLKILRVLSEMSHEIREKGLCSKDKRADKVMDTITRMDSSYFKSILDRYSKLSENRKKLTDNIKSIKTEEHINDIDQRIKQLRHEAEQAKDTAKKPEKTKKCPKCGEDISADWIYHRKCGWKEEKEQKEEDEEHGKSRILVFTSPTCPHCPHALRLAKEVEKERTDVRVTEISTGTPSGRRKAEQMEVMAVPTLFVKGPAYAQNIGLKGIPSKKGLLKAIDISLGLAEWEEPKGLFKSILDKLPLKIKW